MDLSLLEEIYQQNPWLKTPHFPIFTEDHYISRLQFDFLVQSEWNKVWTILIGPRQAGKTTIGLHLSQKLLQEKKFKQLLYLSCDYKEIRQWLTSPVFLTDIEKNLELKDFILFIDEVQRLESPGLLLKIIHDLKLPIKMIAAGSSQLEIKSKVQEHLTGRKLEALILPLSCREIDYKKNYMQVLHFGSYPQVYLSNQKQINHG